MDAERCPKSFRSGLQEYRYQAGIRKERKTETETQSGHETFQGHSAKKTAGKEIDIYARASLVAQTVTNIPAMQETRFDTWVRKIP